MAGYDVIVSGNDKYVGRVEGTYYYLKTVMQLSWFDKTGGTGCKFCSLMLV